MSNTDDLTTALLADIQGASDEVRSMRSSATRPRVINALDDLLAKLAGDARDLRGEITPERAAAFLQDLAEVCRRHGLSLSHEDGHGSFQVVVPYDPSCVEWLLAATVEADR